MRITPESFTVIPDPLRGEISLLIAGLNVVLDLEEARELARQLLSGMQKLGRAERVPDRLARPPERPPVPTPERTAATEPDRDKATKSAFPEGRTAAEEPLLLSSATAIAGTPADSAPADGAPTDKRERKRLRSFLKVLGKEDDGAVAGSG